MATHKLKFKKNYFISEAGYVFKIVNGKEEILKSHVSRTRPNPFVFIENKPYDLLYLMLEHFNVEIHASDSIRYKVGKDNYIQLSSIKIVKNRAAQKLSEEDARDYIVMKCEAKAASSNIRCDHKISGMDIFAVLKLYKFRCVYCNNYLKNKSWHIDHFDPLSGQGKNKIENIVPSCPRCNIMKSNLEGKAFIAWCKKVVEKNQITNMEIGKEEVGNG